MANVFRQQAGSSLLVLLVALVVLAGVGTAAYVVQQHNKTVSQNTTQTTSSTGAVKKTSLTLKSEQISLDYPSDWSLVDMSVSAPTDTLLGKPGSDRIELTSTNGLQLWVNTANCDTSTPASQTEASVGTVKTLGTTYKLAPQAEVVGETSDKISGVMVAQGTSIRLPAKNTYCNNNPSSKAFTTISIADNDVSEKDGGITLSDITSHPDYAKMLDVIKSMHY